MSLRRNSSKIKFGKRRRKSKIPDEKFDLRIQTKCALIQHFQRKGDLEIAKRILRDMRSEFLAHGIPWIEANGSVTQSEVGL